MKNSYGFDRLSRDMLMLAVALGIIGLAFFGSISGFVLLFTAVLLTALMLFRTLSANGNKRANECVSASIGGFFAKLFNRIKNLFKRHKQYRYFTCPKCRQRLRAPRGKGKIRVTCSKCGTQFEKRT